MKKWGAPRLWESPASCERGQTAVEYAAVLLIVLAVVTVVAAVQWPTLIASLLDRISSAL